MVGCPFVSLIWSGIGSYSFSELHGCLHELGLLFVSVHGIRDLLCEGSTLGLLIFGNSHIGILPILDQTKEETRLRKGAVLWDHASDSLMGHRFTWTSKVPKILAFIPKMKGMWAIVLGTLEVQAGFGGLSKFESPAAETAPKEAMARGFAMRPSAVSLACGSKPCSNDV